MTYDLESLGRLRLQGIILLAVLFVIGALTGAAFERTREHGPKKPPADSRGLPPGMQKDLNLTAAQQARIDSIITASRPRTDAILDQFLPRLRTLADSIRTDIRAVLTADQQKIFDKMQHPPGMPPFADKPLQGMHPGPPPGGPHPGGDRPPQGDNPPPNWDNPPPPPEPR
ncbi:MAG: hypothetical protein PHD74_10780 [Candidatus Krumholzibacteria bacterium]|nr:hypothetical protein [Candidatus Krumholzibacteria bacterium]